MTLIDNICRQKNMNISIFSMESYDFFSKIKNETYIFVKNNIKLIKSYTYNKFNKYNQFNKYQK